MSVATWEEAKAAVAALTSSLTKAELLEAAIERRLLMAPIADLADVLESPQYAARGYLVDLELDGATVKAPGAFAKASVTPLRELTAVAAAGEHTDRVLAAPRQPVNTPQGVASPTGRPLEGLKVVDFMWSLAGPFTSRLLSDLGATVIKIESIHKPDAGRGFLPVWDNVPGLEQSALFDSANAGKLSLALDMRKPEAREVLKELVAWGDVLCESFSPRAMTAWGLHYEALAEINPRLVMLSTCLMGQYGPLANFAGYGNLGAALSGFYGLAGWPDRAPAGPFGAYTDYTSTHLIAATLLAALDHQRRTGQGQHIDMAQTEAATYFLAGALVETAATGYVTQRDGNRDRFMAPHGGYRCEGDDRWVAVAVPDDDTWQRLCDVIERPDLAADGNLGTARGRVAAAERLDEAVEAWTQQRSAPDAEAALVAAGVPAHRIQSSRETLDDPQLTHRNHFLWMEHPDRGCLIENLRMQFSRSEAGPTARAPKLGEHTFDVLTEILGYDGDRIADLAVAEALE